LYKSFYYYSWRCFKNSKMTVSFDYFGLSYILCSTTCQIQNYQLF
jgi:hypothetical protein